METVQSLTGNLPGGFAWIAGAAGFCLRWLAVSLATGFLKVWTTLIGFAAGFYLGSYISGTVCGLALDTSDGWPFDGSPVCGSGVQSLSCRGVSGGRSDGICDLCTADSGGYGMDVSVVRRDWDCHRDFAVWFVKPVIIVVSSLQGGFS